jgi:amino acid transporter
MHKDVPRPGKLMSSNPPPSAGDEALDASAASDSDYLASLGYQQELKRGLGLLSSFGVQFSSIAVVSASYTTLVVGLGFFGPASFWSWVIGGTLQVFAVGLAIAELVSAYPLAGGVYQINNRILRQAKGRLFRSNWLGWQTGWWIVIAHTVAVSTLAWSMVPFVASWFGVAAPSTIATLWWALGIVALVSIVNFIGVKVAATVNNIGVLAELIGGAMIIVALLVVHHHTQPVSIVNNTAGTVSHGEWFKPFLFAFILPAYIISSFDSSGNAAEETHGASRKAPLGLLAANSTAWVYGMVMMFLLYLAIPSVKGVMASVTPVHYILTSAVGEGFTTVVQALVIAALTACCAILQLTAARVLWSQARDGQMPGAGWMKKVSRNQVPFNATLTAFAMSVIFLIVAANSATALAILAAMTALAWALSYGVTVTTGLWALMTHRLPKRPFSTGRAGPFVFTAAVIWSVVICGALVWQNPKQVGGGMAAVIVVGLILYYLIPSARRQEADRRSGVGNQVGGVSTSAVTTTES